VIWLAIAHILVALGLTFASLRFLRQAEAEDRPVRPFVIRIVFTLAWEVVLVILLGEAIAAWIAAPSEEDDDT
jgi:hypothetical protein